MPFMLTFLDNQMYTTQVPEAWPNANIYQRGSPHARTHSFGVEFTNDYYCPQAN